MFLWFCVLNINFKALYLFQWFCVPYITSQTWYLFHDFIFSKLILTMFTCFNDFLSCSVILKCFASFNDFCVLQGNSETLLWVYWFSHPPKKIGNVLLLSTFLCLLEWFKIFSEYIQDIFKRHSRSLKWLLPLPKYI